MDWLDSIPEAFRSVAILVFIVASAIFAAWSSRRGAREPGEDNQPKVREFAVTGQLADMGPIRELIEDAGLLIQQQVKTNLQLGELSEGINRLCTKVEEAIEEWRTVREEHDREEEIERRVQERLEAERRRPARRAPE